MNQNMQTNSHTDHFDFNLFNYKFHNLQSVPGRRIKVGQNQRGELFLPGFRRYPFMDLLAGGGIGNVAVRCATDVNLMNHSQELLGFRRVSGGRVIRHTVQPTMPKNHEGTSVFNHCNLANEWIGRENVVLTHNDSKNMHESIWK